MNQKVGCIRILGAAFPSARFSGSLPAWLAALIATQGLPPLALANSETAPKPVSVTVLYVRESGVASADEARVSRVFHAALRQNRNLTLHDSDKLLAKFAGDVPQAQVRRATQRYKDGQKSLEEGDFAAAAAKLSQSIGEFEVVLPFIEKRHLAGAMLALGVAYAELHKTDKARKTFARLLTWRPSARYDTERYDIRHSAMFERARAALKRQPRGSVELRTRPPGAKAYVDGRFVGVTPTVALGILAGMHYATFKKAGYIRAGAPIDVSPREQLTHEQRMNRSEKFLLLKQSLHAARRNLGQPVASSDVIDLGRVLFVDQLVLTTLRAASSSHLDVRSYLYDIRSRALLNKVRMSVDRAEPRTMEDVARLLYFNVRYDGSLQAPPEPPPPPAPKAAPLYTRWWLWTAVAAGLAAGATAIFLPLALQEEPCPDGYRCATIQN